MKNVVFSAFDASVKGYLHDDHEFVISHKIRPCMIVCPGGAYSFVSHREADPPALAFFAMGYNVFILTYSIQEKASEYRPLKELAQTVHTVRKNSDSWGIDPKRIAVMGFSAGGHLVASLGALWNDSELNLPADCCPDALVLCYPVITMKMCTHADSRSNVTGGSDALCRKLSLEDQVTAQMPPVFVWHTVDDETVPVENTLLLAGALKRAQVPFECHLFAHGQHGLSVCTQEVETPNPEAAQWLPLCKSWLNQLFCFVP